MNKASSTAFKNFVSQYNYIAASQDTPIQSDLLLLNLLSAKMRIFLAGAVKTFIQEALEKVIKSTLNEEIELQSDFQVKVKQSLKLMKRIEEEQYSFFVYSEQLVGNSETIQPFGAIFQQIKAHFKKICEESLSANFDIVSYAKKVEKIRNLPFLTKEFSNCFNRVATETLLESFIRQLTKKYENESQMFAKGKCMNEFSLQTLVPQTLHKSFVFHFF